MRLLVLFVMLTGVTHGFFTPGETKCNATRNPSLCSAPYGGNIYIQLMTNASGYRIHCTKNNGSTNVFILKKQKVTVKEAFRDRMDVFINNGTLKITSLEKDDAGQYTVEIFSFDGRLLRTISVKLDVHENKWSIVIPACGAVAVLLLLLISVCICRKVKRRKQSGSGNKWEWKSPRWVWILKDRSQQWTLNLRLQEPFFVHLIFMKRYLWNFHFNPIFVQHMECISICCVNDLFC